MSTVTTMCNTKTLAAWLLIFTGLVAMGCSQQDAPKRIPIKGTVRLNGQPVDGGRILFIPKDGAGITAGGSINDQGLYDLNRNEAPVAGEHTVRVTVNITDAEDKFQKRTRQDNQVFNLSVNIVDQNEMQWDIDLSSKSKGK